MRKCFFICLSLLLTMTLLLYSEENEEEWKQDFASPSYGIAMLYVTIDGADDGFSDTLLLMGMDARIFMGTNVSKKGGFFSGIEVGAFFFPSDEGVSFSDSYTDSGENTFDYSPNLNYTWAMVFMTAKYGYRVEFGTEKLGFGIGGDTGIGVRLGNGEFHLSISDDDGNSHTVYWSADYEALLDIILDLNLEATVRVGTNFRVFLRGGFVVTPLGVPGGTDNSIWSNGASLLDFSDGTDSGELGILVNRYRMDFVPVIGSIRLGFILNY